MKRRRERDKLNDMKRDRIEKSTDKKIVPTHFSHEALQMRYRGNCFLKVMS